MNVLSAIRMLDQALAAMTGQRAPATGESLPVATEGTPAATRISFEQWLATQSGGNAPTEDSLAGQSSQGGDAASDDAVPDGEREAVKPAGKKRELNPAEHPLLAPYMPAPDAPRPIAGAPVASGDMSVELSAGRQVQPGLVPASTEIAKQAEPQENMSSALTRIVPTAAKPPAPDTMPRSATDDPTLRASASESAPTADSAPKLKSATANARPEYIAVTSATRVAVPVTGETSAAPVEGQKAAVIAEGETVPAQPVDRLKARIAAYIGRESEPSTDTATSSAVQSVRPAQPAVDGLRRTKSAAAPQLADAQGVSPDAASAIAKAAKPMTVASASAPIPGEPAMASDAIAKAASPQPAPPQPAPATMAAAVPVSPSAAAVAVEPAGKARRKDGNIGDPSAFGLDGFAKAATGLGDPAQLFGAQQVQPATLPQTVAAQAAGQAVPMDRSIIDFSQGLAWIDRLASEISAMGSKEGKLSFDINPENMGPLTVSMKKGETGINLALHVTSHDAANILAASHTQLKQELNNAGLQLGSFDIGNQPASGGDGNGGSAARTGTDARSADQAGEVATDGAAEILGGQPDSGVRFA